ncbi:MAG: YXWGXW repeat-containing protein [Phycisphaerales bacterium]|nr:YXWGXW repeat-containing protein [Phycisphaerales bacterium]
MCNTQCRAHLTLQATSLAIALTAFPLANVAFAQQGNPTLPARTNTKADEHAQSDPQAGQFIPIPTEPGELDIITVEPSEEHVWIPGYWERGDGKWDWVKGRWEKPPHKSAIWHKGHWKWEDGKWQWHKGHWAVEEGEGYIVNDYIEIPPPVYETKPARLTQDARWLPGYWEWAGGNWIWVPGYWDRAHGKYRNIERVEPAWHQNTDGTWRWMAAHWVDHGPKKQ